MVEFSLYFHIPFCTKKCPYCHFYVIPDDKRHKKIWFEAIQKEWQIRSPLCENKKLVSVYFGGGTPSLLDPEYFAHILQWIRPDPLTEITLEANPENIDAERFKIFKQLGINRLSLGAQAFDATLLNKIGRTHTVSATERAIERAEKAGFDNISIDLMYDLPSQTVSQWKKSVEKAVSLPVTHISLYNLTIEPHTVFFKNQQILKREMPDQDSSLKMLDIAVETFLEAGFERYEISAFAKNGCRSTHNIGYWTFRPFLGLGPSSFSFWDGARFRNVSHLMRYAKALFQNKDPRDFYEKLEPLESLKERVAIGLRLLPGIPDGAYLDPLSDVLKSLIRKGWIEPHNGNIRLTSAGLIFHDSVAEHLFQDV